MKCSLDISNFLEKILVFPILLFSSICLHWSLISLISPCYSLELCIQMDIAFLFSFAFSLSSFLRLLVRPPQSTILPFCISFSWGWSWSLPPVQCHEPPSIVMQALCLSDLISWIYLSLTQYNQGFYLGHTWMVYWFSLLSSVRILQWVHDVSHSWLPVLFLLTL